MCLGVSVVVRAGWLGGKIEHAPGRSARWRELPMRMIDLE
jgi:hypothetical protein